MAKGLPVNRLIQVSVNLDPLAAQFANFNSFLIIGDSNVIDVEERIRSYGSLEEVASDFGTTAPEYLGADLYFSQAPQPTQLYIARWAQTATEGLLVCGILTAAQQAIGPWQAITTGGFHITVNGGSSTLVDDIDLAGASNLNAVATLINAALTAATLAVNCTWTGDHFVFNSTTTGSTSSVSVLTVPGTGTDLSAMLKGTVGLAQYTVGGIAAETAVAAVALLDDLSTSWYCFSFAATAIVDADHLAVAAFTEGAGNPHIYTLTTQNTAALSSTDSTSIGYQLKQFAYKRTGYQYSSSSPYANCSLVGRILTTDFNAANSTITLAFKQEPGVVAENLRSSQADALDANNYNYFANFNNGVAIIVNGQMASGNYFDEIYGADWLANNVQTNCFNLLLVNGKIPQTDPGNHEVVNVIEASFEQGVNNGFIGRGLVWSSGGFGTLSEGDILPKGYYVYAPPIALQPLPNRQARKSVPFQCAVTLAGAIQDIDVIINVAR